MNPAFYKIWQHIRAIVISRVWQDRNAIAHHKPSLNLDKNQMKSSIMDACRLAREMKNAKPFASIMLRKLAR